MTHYSRANLCRACRSDQLRSLFSLGNQAIVAFPSPEDPRLRYAPLDLMMCSRCTLVQLEHSVHRDLMYSTYWYKSGMNQSMQDSLRDVVESAQSFIPLKRDDIVIDIGSNDGTLASFYPDYVRKVGFEPCYGIWSESHDKAQWWKSFNSYFKKVEGISAKIITSCAMFYDLDDPGKFVDDINAMLHPGGLWVDQQNHLGQMIENSTYDNISHEHVAYYSFQSFRSLLTRHGMTIVKVQLNSVNGGSMRSYIQRSQDVQSTSVPEFQEISLGEPYTYDKFYERISLARDELRNFVCQEKAKGKSFYLYGASTRGQIILQFCGFGPDLIDGAAERNPAKYGLLTVGIPIYPEEYVRERHPDYMIVLPYSFRDEFIEREQDYLQSGGALVFPLPAMDVVRVR